MQLTPPAGLGCTVGPACTRRPYGVRVPCACLDFEVEDHLQGGASSRGKSRDVRSRHDQQTCQRRERSRPDCGRGCQIQGIARPPAPCADAPTQNATDPARLLQLPRHRPEGAGPCRNLPARQSGAIRAGSTIVHWDACLRLVVARRRSPGAAEFSTGYLVCSRMAGLSGNRRLAHSDALGCVRLARGPSISRAPSGRGRLGDRD